MDPGLVEAVHDYATRTHAVQFNNMEALMKPRKRLIADEELPPIGFSIVPKDLEKEDRTQEMHRDTFFQSYFDHNVSSSQHPDLEKKLIAQNKMLEANNISGFEKARYLKEQHVTL